MLTHRQNNVFTQASDNDLQAATGSVVVFRPGGIVKTSSNGNTITLYGGHGFVGGEKFMRGIDIATFSGVVTVLSVAGNILTVDGNYTVDAGDRLVNLGPDSGIANGPNFDQSSVTIYSTPDPTNVIDQSRVDLNETGFYEYWHTGLALWEVIRGGDGTPIAIDIGASEAVARSFAFGVNVKTYGATGDGVTDDTAAIQAAINSFLNDATYAEGGNGGRLLFPQGVYVVSSQLTVGAGINIEGESALASVIKLSPTFSGARALLFQKPTGQYANNGIGMRNIQIDCQSVDCHAVQVYKGYDAVTFDTVYVDNVGFDNSAFRFEPDPTDTVGDHISQTVYMANCYGIHGPASSTGSVFYFKHVQEMTLVNCKAFGGYVATGVGNCDIWEFDGCRGVSVFGGAVALNAGNGIRIKSTQRSSQGLFFYGMTIEGVGNAALVQGNVFPTSYVKFDGTRYQLGGPITTGGFVFENVTMGTVQQCHGFTLTLDSNCNRCNFHTEDVAKLLSDAGNGTKVYADHHPDTGNKHTAFIQPIAIYAAEGDATGPEIHWGHMEADNHWRMFWSRSASVDNGFRLVYVDASDVAYNVYATDANGSQSYFYAPAGTELMKLLTGLVRVTGTIEATVAERVTSPQGATWVKGRSEEEITLSTGGLTTDSVANLLPANSIIEAVCARVTTTITTTTNWAVGDSATSARFSSANATLTAGTTSVGLNHQKGNVTTEAAGPTQTAAAPVRITCTGANPGAGKIRVTVFYRTLTAPTS